MALVPAGAMFICTRGRQPDITQYLRCTECGWSGIDPEIYIQENGQLPLDFEEHTEADCQPKRDEK